MNRLLLLVTLLLLAIAPQAPAAVTEAKFRYVNNVDAAAAVRFDTTLRATMMPDMWSHVRVLQGNAGVTMLVPMGQAQGGNVTGIAGGGFSVANNTDFIVRTRNLHKDTGAAVTAVTTHTVAAGMMGDVASIFTTPVRGSVKTVNSLTLARGLAGTLVFELDSDAPSAQAFEFSVYRGIPLADIDGAFADFDAAPDDLLTDPEAYFPSASLVGGIPSMFSTTPGSTLAFDLGLPITDGEGIIFHGLFSTEEGVVGVAGALGIPNGSSVVLWLVAGVGLRRHRAISASPRG